MRWVVCKLKPGVGDRVQVQKAVVKEIISNWAEWPHRRRTWVMWYKGVVVSIVDGRYPWWKTYKIKVEEKYRDGVREDGVPRLFVFFRQEDGSRMRLLKSVEGKKR